MVRPENRAALLVPTYRKDRQALANLAYLAALSGPDMHVWISDCSGDPEKRDFLDGLQRSHPFVRLLSRKQRVPLYPDVAAAMNQMGSYAYVSICADDDYVSLAYLEDSIAFLEKDEASVCSFGNYLLWINGSVRWEAWEVADSSPVVRLQRCFGLESWNRLFFAVFRRNALQAWINFCNGHPLIGAFFDAIHFCSLLVQGHVRYQRKGFYLWTGENWETNESNYDSKTRYYRDVGLPSVFAVFHDLHFAVEGINFFIGEHCPISDLDTRLKCAQTVWSGCMSTFREKVKLQENLYAELMAASPLAVDALRFLVQKESCDDRQILVAFEAILARFSEPLAKTYGAHFRESLARAKVT